ncbi:flagellar hook-basal body complex protein FliE [Nitratiruptor sp. YY08-26]|uniref:flagellar hook-basal body complex protein FliE n=1 Tax=unclassified Nitratiruptor TaxID=2624044 RepID=UPI0019161519|nr:MULTISPECIES: flagellar hook-basal body complex protein FliE [unclassified Nitratiruptor]BCD61862.1 flagellar hook-basal body complex protein FliE [Nitratiruptor sp. YY08-13]BCD65797.1 flagellar hook-basal body complex protein FliE [Nitratiruptor sp. YY08-26]
MKIDGVSSALSANIAQIQTSQKSDFADLVEKFVADINGDLQAASNAQAKLIQGDVDNMIELMSTIEKADISLRLATEIRNKAIEAYQEIMRMQV